MSSETLKKYLLNGLKGTSSGVLSNTLSLALTKRELLSMSGEELEVVKNFVKEYRIGHYKLHPKSFERFLGSEKYGEDCTAIVRIPLEELVKRGVLTLSEEGGRTYWCLYGEKLDPKQYYRLYLKDHRTFRTLLEDLELAELIDRYDVEPTPQNPMTIFTIKLGEVNIDVHYISGEHPSLMLSAHTSIDGSAATELPRNTLVDVRINIKNPKVEDLPKIENLVRDIRSDVKAKISKIVEWIRRNFENRVGEVDVEVSGTVIVKNFELSMYTLLVKGRHDLDSNANLAVEVQYTAPQELKVSVTQTIKSRHLVNALRDIGIKSTGLADGGGEYAIDVNTENKTVAFGFSKRFDVSPELENLPDVSEEVDVIMNMKTILHDVIVKGLEKIKDEKLTLYVRDRREELDRTVRGFLEVVGWREDQSVEEAILRIWMLKTILDNLWEPEKVKPDIISILISLTYLRGVPHDYVVDKVKMGLDYAVSLALRGRLKITEHDVYLDGRRFDINPANYSFIKSVLYAIKFLTSSKKKNTDTEKTKNTIATEV
ncbi:MAG: hypothetical protein QXE66_03295 [Desulfurococcaceae archaeon]